MADLILKNGFIVDGSGNPWYKADIEVKNGRIFRVDKLHNVEASRVIDVNGLVIAPGFIDVHSHSDWSVIVNPLSESKIRQGITTECIGNCGASAAPLDKEKLGLTKKELGPIASEITWDWLTFDEYLRKLEKQGSSVNIVFLVGHGTIRVAVMGYENQAPSQDEMECMKNLVVEAMDAGAIGMSTGLIYPPGCYAETNELIELAKVVSEKGGFYASHIRGESQTLVQAVKEAIEIGERANIPVEISHHKAAGKVVWGKVKETLKMIQQARLKGLDVTCDVYPYVAGSTSFSSILPNWMHEGGIDETIKRLKDPNLRRKLKEEMKKKSSLGENLVSDVGWDSIRISFSEKHPDYEGKTLLKIAELRNTNPFDAAFDLIIEDYGTTGMIIFSMNEGDVETVIGNSVSMIGTDASSRAPYGFLSRGKPHPRSYGTCPRVLKTYCRESGVLRLEEAVRKMTSLPAQRLGLTDRGLLLKGMWADIVIFDKDVVADVATFDNPHQYPKGIEYVIVNGVVSIEKGEHTKALAGKTLRKKRV